MDPTTNSSCEIRFMLDVHLGKLAKYLRLCGFDSALDEDLDDKGIIERAVQDKRIILTRDKMLLENKLVTHGYRIISSRPVTQTEEVFQRFDLSEKIKPFSRCLECNMVIEQVDKEKILDLIPPKTQKYYDEFRKCPGCGRIYWKGSHYEKMIKFITSITQRK